MSYARAYAYVQIMGRKSGSMLPMAGASVTPRDPGTVNLYTGALYLNPDDSVPAIPPFTAGPGGELSLWSDEPVRLDLNISSVGFVTQTITTDLALSPDSFASKTHEHQRSDGGDWHFSNNTTAGDPGTGNMRTDTGNTIAPTQLRMSRTTDNGFEMPLTNSVQPDDLIYVQDKNDSTLWTRFKIITKTNFTSYEVFDVTVMETSGTSINNNQTAAVVFTMVGTP